VAALVPPPISAPMPPPLDMIAMPQLPPPHVASLVHALPAELSASGVILGVDGAPLSIEASPMLLPRA
jgi:hypothetical protein